MTPPLHRLKKAELLYLATHRCRHGHRYLNHYACFQTEQHPQPKLGFFDIETFGLDAAFGIAMSYSIKPLGEDDILGDVMTLADIRRSRAGDEDRRLVTACIRDMQKFDTLVTHYGNDWRFDVPFIRTRAVSMGIPFPYYGTIRQLDTYPVLKSKFRLPSNRQEAACRTLLGATEKNHIDGHVWRAAMRGDPKALSYVADHNRRDVRDLERLYLTIEAYSGRRPASL